MRTAALLCLLAFSASAQTVQPIGPGMGNAGTAPTTPVALVWHPDSTNYFVGSYGGYMGPFNGSGNSWNDTMIIVPGSFQDNVAISWQWATTCASVCGYLSLSYGDYFGTSPPTAVTPVQVQNITTLIGNHGFSFGSASYLPGFDMIYDFFTTLTPDGDGNHLHEVEIFVHTNASSAAYIASVTQITNSLVVSGITWTVAYDSSVTDILIMPTNQADIPSGPINILSLLQYAVSQGLMANTEYFNGLALGIEPKLNNGSVFINNFSITFAP